jgi:hypothetical protein
VPAGSLIRPIEATLSEPIVNVRFGQLLFFA